MWSTTSEILILVAATATVVIPTLTRTKIESGKLSVWGIAFIVSAFVAFAGSWYNYYSESNRYVALLEKMELESTRLKPSDFQIRLTLMRENSLSRLDKTDLPVVHCEGYMDSAAFNCELVNVYTHDDLGIGPWSPAYEEGFYGGTGQRYDNIIRFYAQNITFAGLENYPYIKSLEGLTFSMRVKLEDSLFKTQTWTHSVDLFVAGRRFPGIIDEKGDVSIHLRSQ